MKLRVLVLGAGFGGLELSTILSDELGDQVDVTLIDKSDAFFIGFSKFDVMFGRKSAEAVRMPYRNMVKPGVRFRQETVTAIDPAARRVTTDGGTYEADVLVVALGADYDFSATPGLSEGGYEFYSFAGAERLRAYLPTFAGGNVVVGVADTPFKCPPAPSESVLLMHDYLVERGLRDQCRISLVMPFGNPIPPSPETSQALLDAFAERDIQYIPDRLVDAYDPARKMLALSDGDELPCDLFMCIPKHRVPAVVAESGLCRNDWVPVDAATLKTEFPGVYAIGDVTSVGTPKAGVFAEGAARVVAQSLIADLRGGEQPDAFDGIGACYIEFGNARVGRVEVNFLSAPKPTGFFTAPSTGLVQDKAQFATVRRARWFGL
ncbi:MAG: FAD-dependent oxidoreductase [Caldilineaceae bacterium]|nr:FAD-dependent oxidoreductase [Caldilineaceae bacterium]